LQSIQDDEPAGPIERQAASLGGSRAGSAGIRVNSFSRRDELFAGPSRRPRVWVLAVGATVVTSILASGWIGRGSPVNGGAAEDAFWKIGKPVAIAVRDGRSTFRVPTPLAASEVLVVVSALARSRGPFPIAITARQATEVTAPLIADDGPRRMPRLAGAPAVQPTDAATPRGLPPLERAFHMLVRDGDPASPSNYAAIRGVLKGVGRKVQVYVAAEDVEQVSGDLVRDLIATFDDQVYPLSARAVGTARDVDGDGRFTILLSSWLDHLGGGRYPVDGFVRVADLDPAYRSPFGNQCDMMYLNTALKEGPHTRTLLAHEYMHAVVFTQKTFRTSRGPRLALEEEGWLDEAIAHVAEDMHGFSTSNIDYRVSAFLSCPERYQLVVDDYYAADLFRSHGNRGSTYLFLRWCVDRYGPELLPALVHSQQKGAANLEVATGATFGDLYRRWSLALFQSGLEPTAEKGRPGADGFVSLNVRAPCEQWELAGPRFTRIRPAGPVDCWQALSTSSHFAVVASSPTGAVEVEIAGPPDAELQVTALPLGADLARIDLSVTKIHGSGGEICLRVRVNERHGVPVCLSALSWEPLTPSPNPRSNEFRCGRLDMRGIAGSFGTSALSAGGELSSRPIPLPGVSSRNGPLAIKIIGTDQKGRRIAAWAELAAEPEPLAGDP
jgi:hypothetical protein